jgi:glycosyltransferase involved in cell wall biosynthesis
LCADPHGSGKLRRMGQALCEYVSADYTWTSVVKKYIKLYERILSGGGTA